MKSRKIKICHIVNRITGKADGVFKHLMAQLTLLNKDEFEQIVICPYSEQIDQKFKKLNLRVYYIPELNTHFHLKVFSRIKQILKNENCQIYCCHLLKPLLIGGLLNLFNRKKIVFFSHGIILNNEYNTSFEKIVYKILLNLIFKVKDVFVLAPSEKSIALFRENFKSIKNYKVYYDGEAVIDDPEVSDNNLKNISDFLQYSNSFKILYAGRLEIEKAPLDAIKIFEEFQKEVKDASLYIFGDGSLETTIKNYVEKKSLQNVYVYGFQKNIHEIFGLFAVLLLTSRREGMPVVIWEALNAGVPFISKDVGGITELLRFGQCGFVYHNHKEAIDYLKLMYKNPDRRKELGHNGQEIIKHHFNKQKFIDFFTKFYFQLL